MFAASTRVLLLLSMIGCSTVFEPELCSSDDDCVAGAVCALRDQAPVCVDAADDTLVMGMSAPVSGTNQALGTGMRLGVALAFDEKNEEGGVRGRQLRLEFRDDAYVPELAEAAARSLVDAQSIDEAPRCPTTTTPAVDGQEPISSTALVRGSNAVLAFIGNVGTPTMVRAAPVAIETGTIFFGAFTGAATILRDDRAAECKSYIFNVRASYAQEARATMEYFSALGITDLSHVISFDQNDSFGQAGYDGMVKAFRDVVGEFPAGADPSEPIVRFRYTRNDDASVPAQVEAAAAYLADVLDTGGSEVHRVGIMMTDTYGAGAAFIEGLRGWQMATDEEQASLDKANRLKLYFSNVSFVGPNALAQRLVDAGTLDTPAGPRPYTEGVVVSQVVPNYQSDSSDAVTSYGRLIAEGGHQPDFTSLEGYIAARIFIAALETHEGPFEPDGLVRTLEALPDLSLGIGVSSGFSAENHQYSNSVWGTALQADGSFKNLYFWTAGLPIQFFE